MYNFSDAILSKLPFEIYDRLWYNVNRSKEWKTPENKVFDCYLVRSSIAF